MNLRKACWIMGCLTVAMLLYTIAAPRLGLV